MMENKGNKLVVDDIEIIVRGLENKPYYEIKYREVGSDDYNIGFGSYNLSNVIKWKEEEFEIVPENKDTIKEIFNKLERIEHCQGLLLNDMNALFSVIISKADKYDKEIIKTLKAGLLENTLCSDDMMMTMVERNEKQKREMQEKYGEEDCVDSLIDLLESLL